MALREFEASPIAALYDSVCLDASFSFSLTNSFNIKANILTLRYGESMLQNVHLWVKNWG